VALIASTFSNIGPLNGLYTLLNGECGVGAFTLAPDTLGSPDWLRGIKATVSGASGASSDDDLTMWRSTGPSKFLNRRENALRASTVSSFGCQEWLLSRLLQSLEGHVCRSIRGLWHVRVP
jgi:hypothetical protein